MPRRRHGITSASPTCWPVRCCAAPTPPWMPVTPMAPPSGPPPPPAGHPGAPPPQKTLTARRRGPREKRAPAGGGPAAFAGIPEGGGRHPPIHRHCPPVNRGGPDAPIFAELFMKPDELLEAGK